jgi:starch synthase
MQPEIRRRSGMKVLYCAAECKPFAKAGGVGDVAGELPLALKELGIDIEIAMPLYGSIDSELVENQEQVGSPLEVRYAGGTEKVTVRRGRLGDVPVYFFKNATFFGGPEVYIHSEPTPFLDDIKRFSFFSEALLAFVRSHQPDIVHINDWVLGYLFGRMAMEGFEQKRVLTVHNVGYQGLLYDKKASNLHINLLR